LQAIDGATGGPVEEGSVGAGTGMSAFGHKGGIGTASRMTPEALGGWTVGVLVLANFGRLEQLRIDGVPVGAALAGNGEDVAERGSIMIVVATSAPLLDRGLRRIARRAGIGLARTGSIAGHGSGDYVIAFSASELTRIAHEPASLTHQLEIVVEAGQAIDALFRATVEATEEAIVNALFRATTMTGRDGNTRKALPLDRVQAIMRRAGRLNDPRVE
ncbi:MAG TPA: P1 family peptidase, partial [Thermomicrobiales bacterium]|nr:P1 family peptidase [Thermomicrobiales bacterium]